MSSAISTESPKPTSSKNKTSDFESKEHPLNTSLIEKGYKITHHISNSLQGHIFLGIQLSTNKRIIIKTANYNLYKKGITLINKKKIKISENILKEANIMNYLTKQKNRPSGFIKIHNFFKLNNNYFLIQQFGGIGFFEYLINKHKIIKNDNKLINEWKIQTINLFGQLVNTINWLHNKMSVCHLDISIENMVYNKKTNKVKLIDFGLSEIFNKQKNPNFLCTKFCGKLNYNSIEIANKQKFDARKADIWALGVCLYMIAFGIPPYKKPNFDDIYFKNLYCGYLKQMMIDFNMINYLTNDIHDLFYKIFVAEKQRYFIQDIMKHKFLKNYEFDIF